MPAYTKPLREALTSSASSGQFADTKIILCSRKNAATKTIHHQRALYANGKVLESVPYLKKLLSEKSGGSDEGAVDDEYCADSDLEEDPDEPWLSRMGKFIFQKQKLLTVPKVSSGSGPPPSPSRRTPNPSYGTSSFLDDLPTYTESSSPPAYLDCNPASRPERGAATIGDWSDGSCGIEKVIEIHDIAFITFQAFLLYLYTGRIQFAPCGSVKSHKIRNDKIPQPSPKSIYRLADKYDILPLKQLALDGIKGMALEKCDLVEELFSEFSSKYPAVRPVFLYHLRNILSHPTTSAAVDLLKKLREKIDYCQENQVDARDVKTLLYESAIGSSFIIPLPKRNTPDQTPTPSLPANWKQVESALIKSIREGIFFDRKYWARQSKNTSALQPVYMSSIIIGKQLRFINGLVKTHREGECLDTSEGSEDSDLEIISEQASGSTQKIQDKKKEGIEPGSLPVLTVGSFASWRSFFFYSCTDHIEFAPLKSQGLVARAQGGQMGEAQVLDQLPPCSPKEIYTLAKLLKVETLRDLAFTDIKLKVTPENVATELVSKFTSKHEEIAEVQTKRFFDYYHHGREQSEIDQRKALMECLLSENSAHHAMVLRLVLNEGFSRSLNVHCPAAGCSYHEGVPGHELLQEALEQPRSVWGPGISRSSLRPHHESNKLYCPFHPANYMVICGELRTSTHLFPLCRCASQHPGSVCNLM